MQDVNVVVVFDSRDESVERLALAAAVGAVQGRALIRLRRFFGTPETREYVTPREADAEWAHAFVVAAKAASEETAPYLASLRERPNLTVVEIDCNGSTEAACTEGRRAAEIARAAHPKADGDS